MTGYTQSSRNFVEGIRFRARSNREDRFRRSGIVSCRYLRRSESRGRVERAVVLQGFLVRVLHRSGYGA